MVTDLVKKCESITNGFTFLVAKFAHCKKRHISPATSTKFKRQYYKPVKVPYTLVHVAETKNTHVNDVTMYNMNHSKSVYMANDTTLDLGHRKFAVDIALAFSSGYIYCKLPLTSVSGSIFAIYTSSL